MNMPLPQNSVDNFSLNIENNDLQNSLNEVENWRSKIKTDIIIPDDQLDSKRFFFLNYVTPCAGWNFIDTNKAIGFR